MPEDEYKYAHYCIRFCNEDDFMILSHTVDPDVDSVGRLKVYADSLKVDGTRWMFLTGSKEKLYEAARKSYLLDDQNNTNAPIEEQFVHTQLFARFVNGIFQNSPN